MQGYFSYLPNINYVSRSTDRSSNDEFIQVKNIAGTEMRKVVLVN